jgi:8-oxo-dGTP pyrophosphatase MutT (NUDIX family)
MTLPGAGSSLDAVVEPLDRFDPLLVADRHRRKRSAVVMLLREAGAGGVEILMIERAQRQGDPWSGHMGFPGGRLDPGDAHSYAAALRECVEEIGLDVAQHGRYLGRLSDLETHLRSGSSAMLVTPFVFAVADMPPLTPNYEVADILWIPLGYLATAEYRRSMPWQYEGIDAVLPYYIYQDRRIWGLSLGMLDELLKVIGLADFEPVEPGRP